MGKAAVPPQPRAGRSVRVGAAGRAWNRHRGCGRHAAAQSPIPAPSPRQHGARAQQRGGERALNPREGALGPYILRGQVCTPLLNNCCFQRFWKVLDTWCCPFVNQSTPSIEDLCMGGTSLHAQGVGSAGSRTSQPLLSGPPTLNDVQYSRVGEPTRNAAGFSHPRSRPLVHRRSIGPMASVARTDHRIRRAWARGLATAVRRRHGPTLPSDVA